MVFNWSDINTLSPMLFGKACDPQRTIISTDGIASLFELEPVIGNGFVEMFQFTDGLVMVVFNCSWNESRTFEVFDEGRCRLSFTLDLNISMDVGSEVVDASSPAWRLMNNPVDVITQETVSAGSKTVWVTLAFPEAYLGKFLSNPAQIKTLPQFDVFRKRLGKSIVQSYPLDHQLNQITSNIISLNANDAVYVALAKAKAAELITNALDRMLSNSHIEENSPIRLRSKDREAIRLAHDILFANLSDPPSIRELCSAVGVNRNKLHYGFKEEFGLSPSQCLEEQRLEQAYARLEETDELIYKIAADVGYMNQGSFSTAFRRKYGVTPKQTRSAYARASPRGAGKDEHNC